TDRTTNETQLASARETLAVRQREEEEARQVVSQTRSALDEAERGHRELLDRARRIEIDRERARHENDDLVQRLEQLGLERSQLVDAQQAVERELEEAGVGMETAKVRVASLAEALESARAEDRGIRERESVARAELFRADEIHTSLQGKVNALDALER